MPLISRSSYQPPKLLSNGHVQSIYPHLFRKINDIKYMRERIETPDGDFLDLDWSKIGEGRLAILSHGLEGSSERHYIKGMVRALNNAKWDALAWNQRGCSGEINRKLKSYHSGSSDDLQTVITHVENSKQYREIVLIGFSLGGNVTLKYLGEQGKGINPIIKKAAAFSVPCDLTSSFIELARFSNKVFMSRFLRQLHKKIKQKMAAMPGKINDKAYYEIKNFKDFDNRYTAPLHGFANAQDYWNKCSSKQFISNISIPTLLINAQNDPFLGEECYPQIEAEKNQNFYLEIPASGGHVGFPQFKKDGLYWSERRVIEFFNDHHA